MQADATPSPKLKTTSNPRAVERDESAVSELINPDARMSEAQETQSCGLYLPKRDTLMPPSMPKGIIVYDIPAISTPDASGDAPLQA